jgi:erythromycin esterase
MTCRRSIGRAGTWGAAGILLLAGCLGVAETVQTPAEQERAAVTWLLQHATAVRSVEFDDTDYADLRPLGQAIGNARIVMLGEASHLDGTSFKAKARIIRFLHQEMGFDVVAFESGLYDLHQAWNAIRSGAEPVRTVRRSMFEIWSDSREVQPLVEYIGQRASGPRPLELAGFDSQFTGPLVDGGTGANFVDDLEAYLTARGSMLVSTPEWPAFRVVVDRIARQVYRRTLPTPEERESFSFGAPWLNAELLRLHTASPSLETSRWRQLGDALEAQGRAWFIFWTPVPGSSYSTIRDSAMARNLYWLANTAYPGRKIIVWAHNWHIANDVQNIFNLTGTAPISDGFFRPMGEIIRAMMPGQVYSIGFSAGGGRIGAAGVHEGDVPPIRDIGPPHTGSWEALFLQTQRPNAFLDLKGIRPGGDWIREPRAARPMHYTNSLAVWPNIFDAFFVSSEMEPATAAP